MGSRRGMMGPMSVLLLVGGALALSLPKTPGPGMFPDVYQLDPRSGPDYGDTKFSIKGVNLALATDCGWGVNYALIKQMPVEEQPFTGDVITCVSPPMDKNERHQVVRVSEDNGREWFPRYKKPVFTYYPPPEVKSISPNHGPSVGDTKMVLVVKGYNESMDTDKAACMFHTVNGDLISPMELHECGEKTKTVPADCRVSCTTPKICFQHDPVYQVPLPLTLSLTLTLTLTLTVSMTLTLTVSMTLTLT